jgi:hypothetical protein
MYILLLCPICFPRTHQIFASRSLTLSALASISSFPLHYIYSKKNLIPLRLEFSAFERAALYPQTPQGRWWRGYTVHSGGRSYSCLVSGRDIYPRIFAFATLTFSLTARLISLHILLLDWLGTRWDLYLSGEGVYRHCIVRMGQRLFSPTEKHQRQHAKRRRASLKHYPTYLTTAKTKKIENENTTQKPSENPSVIPK